MAASVNVVVLAGEVAADPVVRRMPDGVERVEVRVSCPVEGRRLLPLPVVVRREDFHGDIGKGSEVLVTGSLERRFYRSGAGARSLTEVVATSVKLVQPADGYGADAPEEVATFGTL